MCIRILLMRTVVVFLLIFMGLMTSCARKVDVYYTASLNGNLLGCDCWGYPEAGLDKRAWYLAENPLPEGALLLDAGNILDTGRAPYLAGLILKTYAELGYQAVAVGTHELADGLEVLVDRSGPTSQVQFLAHNLEIRDDVDSPARPLSFEPFIHDSEDNRFAVVTLVDPEWFAPYLGLYEGRMSVADPAKILKNMSVEAAAAGAEVVILLAHGSESWIRSLMDDVSASGLYEIPVAAVILAGEEKLLEDKLPGGIPLLSPGEEGNRLGVLKLKLRGNRRPGWKNKFIEFHYLGPWDEIVAARGVEYAAYLDEIRLK